jgi:hypothetical protein
MIPEEAKALADYLSGMPRHQRDLDAAIMLRLLARVYEVTKELIDSKSPQQAGAAYDELVDLIKGQPDR